MHRSVLAALVMILAPLLAGAQQLSTSAADAQKDPVLKAMLDELNRSRQQLHFQDMQKPFFIQYVVDDVDDYEAYVLYGSFSVDREQRRRLELRGSKCRLLGDDLASGPK